MLIRFALTAKQREFDEAVNRYPVVLFGGARGAGKSYSLRNIVLKRRFKYPHSIGYIFRKTYPELEANHIAPLFAQFPELRQFYNEGKKTLRIPNGSELRFAYCEHDKDLAKFQGREIHDLGIEEAGDWPEHFYEVLRASNRSSIPGVPARTLLTGNPGGLGHKFLKRLFIERNFRPTENPDDYHFVSAKVYDNPALMKADPQYVSRLSSIKSEVLRRAWLDGDWDVSAGAFFSELNREIHFIDPFPVPKHWASFGGTDYGFNHPAGWQWWRADDDGNVYLTREIIQAKLGIDEQARKVAEVEWALVESGQKERAQSIFHAGHDYWAKKKGTDPTIAEDFQRAFVRLTRENPQKPPLSITLARANIDRKLGASQLRERIRVFPGKDGKPTARLFVFKTCPVTWDCLTRMIHDPDDVEDVLKVDAVEGDPYTGDEGYDTARYACMSRPPIAIPPKNPIMDRYKKRLSPDVPWTVA